MLPSDVLYPWTRAISAKSVWFIRDAAVKGDYGDNGRSTWEPTKADKPRSSVSTGRSTSHYRQKPVCGSLTVPVSLQEPVETKQGPVNRNFGRVYGDGKLSVNRPIHRGCVYKFSLFRFQKYSIASSSWYLGLYDSGGHNRGIWLSPRSNVLFGVHHTTFEKKYQQYIFIFNLFMYHLRFPSDLWQEDFPTTIRSYTHLRLDTYLTTSIRLPKTNNNLVLYIIHRYNRAIKIHMIRWLYGRYRESVTEDVAHNTWWILVRALALFPEDIHGR
jgi:hypothetical protein